MRILALIPARGGSKRVPGKNIRLLGGKPLITWSIEAAQGIAEICDILVSTDNQEIANIAINAGALVPWLRPLELATDEASSIDVAIHALDWYESTNGKVDGLMLLQPTSPFRTRNTIKNGMELFRSNPRMSVIAVSPVQDHPMWALKRLGGYLIPYIDRHGLNNQSQDLDEALIVNGSIYITSPEKMRKEKSFFGEKPVPLIIDSLQELLDIDTEWDFRLCEILIEDKNINS